MTDKLKKSRPLECTITLEFPKDIDGVKYTEVTLKRLTAKEVSDWYEHLKAFTKNNPDSTPPDLPIYSVPESVLDQLDDDDRYEIDLAVADFLPRRFLRTQTSEEQSASPSQTGNSTEL